MIKYNELTIKVSLENFKESSWLEAIQPKNADDYLTMWGALSSSARHALEENRLSEGKILWLLADACSLALSPSSHNQPFKPRAERANGERTVLPEDFQEDDILFFEEIIEEITIPKLRARIADIVWLIKKPRNKESALKAIDAYRQAPLTPENWFNEEYQCWERAIQLCLMLGKGSGTRLAEIESELLISLKNASEKDGYFALKLSELLIKIGLGSDEFLIISENLEQLGNDFAEQGDIYRSKDYFNIASDYYKKAENPDKSVEMTVKIAEEWVKEAEASKNSEQPNYGMAAHCYENAIQTYRKIPKNSRQHFDVDSKIRILRLDLSDAQEKSLTEMGTVSSGAIDIGGIIENAMNAVRDKKVLDALLILVSIHAVKVEKIRESSEKLIKSHPLQSLFSNSLVSKDGRVIAKNGGGEFNQVNQDRLWAKMVENYSMQVDCAVRSLIYPALSVIQQEHHLTESDFYSISNQSSCLPEGRERLFAKALFAGYDNDFVAALHLLVPQVENLVRRHLKQAGIHTTTLDKNGIETENGLSTLMEHPEVNIIFGDDLAFELKALFCDAFGPNLRNELAHGLIGYDESQSVYSVYAWWLTLRIVINSFYNSKQTQPSSPE